MVTVNCNTDKTRSLIELRQFQGDLKKRSDKDIEALAASILSDGLIMPFVIWQQVGDSECHEFLLDGHGRHQALIKIAMREPEILQQQFPVIIVNAETERQAKEQLLLINSQYGKITKQGLASFSEGLSFDTSKIKIPGIKLKAVKVQVSKPNVTHAIIRIKVRLDIVEQLKEMLSTVDGVQVI